MGFLCDNRVQALDEELSQTKTQEEELQVEKKNWLLVQELAETKIQLDELQKNHQDKVDDLENTLKTTHEELGKIKNQYYNMKAERDATASALKKQETQFEADIRQKHELALKLKIEKEDIQKVLDKVQEEKRLMEKDLAETKIQLDELQDKVDDLENKLKTVQKEKLLLVSEAAMVDDLTQRIEVSERQTAEAIRDCE